MFIGLLSACTIAVFGESLAPNSKESIKCVSLNNRQCQARPTREKCNCLIHTISLVIICTLLLTVVSVGYYYYYTRDWSKQKHLLPYGDTNNKLKVFDIKNIVVSNKFKERKKIVNITFLMTWSI